MTARGICQNPGCTRSYLNPLFDVLRHRVEALLMIARHAPNFVPQLSDWERYQGLFQRGTVCSVCGNPLYAVRQTTASSDEEDPRRRVKLNELLDVGDQLQTWGILP